LTRLLDPDAVLKNKVVEFVGKGDFGLASGPKLDGTYERIWFHEPILPDEVAFETGVFLLTKAKAKALKGGVIPKPEPGPTPSPTPGPEPEPGLTPGPQPVPGIETKTLHLAGTIPPEIWNRLGTKIIPKLKSGSDLKIGVDFSVSLNVESLRSFESELRQIIEDLGLGGKIRIEQS
jgi:hypothetical protein